MSWDNRILWHEKALNRVKFYIFEFITDLLDS